MDENIFILVLSPIWNSFRYHVMPVSTKTRSDSDIEFHVYNPCLINRSNQSFERILHKTVTRSRCTVLYCYRIMIT